MFERRHEQLLPFPRFLVRIIKGLGVAAAIDAGALLLGGVGFRCLEDLGWTDALLNAGLVLTGNGPIARMQTEAGKVFLLLYAVLGVIVFAAVISTLMAPVFHRALHAFHVDVPEGGSRTSGRV